MKVLSKEFGVTKAAVVHRLYERSKQVQATARMIVQTEAAMRKLTVGEQLKAQEFAKSLQVPTGDSTVMSDPGESTAACVTGTPELTALQVRYSTDDEGVQTFTDIPAMTRTGNEVSGTAVDWLKASREALVLASVPTPGSILTVSEFQRLARGRLDEA